MDREISTSRRHAYAVLALLCAALALPANGWAASGGAGLTLGSATLGRSGPTPTGAGGSPTPTTSPAAAVAVQNGNVTVSATGDGIALQTRASAILHGGLVFSGSVASSAAGQTLEIERSGHQTGWQWAPTVAATVGSNGSFSAVWNTDHIGRFAIRAVVVSPTSPAVAHQATATPSLSVTVYRPSLATQYGPGFYGQMTACGEKLTTSLIGVANRTLKCGTSVAIYYQGRTLIVPVIDRGPYANGADWDLTEATGQALGISGTAEIAAVSLPVR